MKSPGFKAIKEYQKVRMRYQLLVVSWIVFLPPAVYPVVVVSHHLWPGRSDKLLMSLWCLSWLLNTTSHQLNINKYVLLFGSWTTFQAPFKSDGRTGCGGTCPRCRHALAKESLASSHAPSFSHRILSYWGRPGRMEAASRNGSSSRYHQIS